MASIEYIARALLLRENCVLLCRDIKGGHAYLPGGHVELGEAASQAAVRELQEECGLKGTAAAPLLFWEARFIQRGIPKHELTVVFHVEHCTQRPWPAKIESLESHICFEWVPMEQLEAAGIVPTAVLPWLASGPSPDDPPEWLSINELE